MVKKKPRYQVTANGKIYQAITKEDLDAYIKNLTEVALEKGSSIDIEVKDLYILLEHCDTCDAVAVVHVEGAAWLMRHNWRSHEGMLRGMGVGKDCIQFSFCTNCGKIQGSFPKRIHGRIITTETEGYYDKD